MVENGKIYEAISNVMAEIGAIGKEKKNQQQGFMYRGIDDVMNALQPALVKHKVFIAPDVISEQREERASKNGGVMFSVRLEISYKFYTTDGSFIETKVIGEAMDSGDKATNKAMSIGYKYACFQVFCIPTEEMRDPDADIHEPAPKSSKPTKEEGKPKNSAQAQPNKGVANEVPPAPTSEQMEDVANQKINDVKLSTIRKELDRTGVQEAAICKRYGFNSLADCTEGLFAKVMSALTKTKSKEATANE
ncbi:MAG: hypothetical protein K0R34_2481 [Herbinix sp.]|jgi:hypothetical protein|nr:hypothetical protein [Herbinix sp.]